MGFEKGQKYVFKVCGNKRSGTGLYYEIDVNGTKQYVKAYEFQKQQPPYEIHCICKGINEYGKPVFMQDIAYLISQLYKVGDIGNFRIKSQPDTRGYYEVADENNFCFRLVRYGAEKFYDNQMVRCRITYINLVRVEMEPAENYKTFALPFYDFHRCLSLFSSMDCGEELLQKWINSPVFDNARLQYEEKNPLWIVTMLGIAANHMTQFLQQCNNHNQKKKLLLSYISICSNLLENSDFLTHSDESEARRYQELITSFIQVNEDRLKAFSLMETNDYSTYLKNLMGKLHTSGYLKNAASEMRVFFFLIDLMPEEYLTDVLKESLNVILTHCKNNRFIDIFGTHFIKIIDNSITRLTTPSITLDEPKQVDLLTKALAVRLLLSTETHSTDAYFQVYLSKLYLFAALLTSVKEHTENLLYKSYEALTGTYIQDIVYSWTDIMRIEVLCNKLLTIAPSLTTIPIRNHTFTNLGVELTISSNSFSLKSKASSIDTHNIVPAGLSFLPAIQTNIYLNRNIGLPKSSSDINDYQHLWSEIYQNLFFSTPETPAPRNKNRRLPQAGDEVMIRITGQNATSHNIFNCSIEDNEYWGNGTINPSKQIVSYNVRVSPDSFIDKASGKPYLFRAKVERIEPNGNIIFSMRQGIAKFNIETLDTEERYQVVVSRVDTHQYLCITQGGVTMFIPRTDSTPQLHLNDFLIADIISISSDGNVQGAICGRSYETFDRTEAFCNLIRDYAEGVTSESFGEGSDMEHQINESHDMPAFYLRELMMIIDKSTSLQNSSSDILASLYICLIIAHLLEDTSSEEYYRRGIHQLTILGIFEKNGDIDGASLQRILHTSISVNDEINEDSIFTTHLKILNCLANPDTESALLKLHLNSKSAKIRQLAALVLAYNLLSGSTSSAEITAKLRKEISTFHSLAL